MFSHHSPLIVWPAILQYQGAHELDYIADAPSWTHYLKQHGMGHPDKIRIIDSEGKRFALQATDLALPEQQAISHDMPESWTSMGTASLQEVLELVRAHASELGSCCVAKLYAPNIKAAIALVNSMASDSD